MTTVTPAFPNPPATCLNMNLLDPREQRRQTAPYISPLALSNSYHRGSQRNIILTARMPRDYVVWSLFNFVFLNCCCLGFLAVFYSVRSRDCKIIGDVEKATQYGKKAKSMNTAALIMSTFFIIFAITLMAALLTSQVKWMSSSGGWQLFPTVTKGADRSPSNSTHN